MIKENKFIEKFKLKSKAELEHVINNPSLFTSVAIEAANYILENYSEHEKKKSIIKSSFEKKIEDPIFEERAFFKDKWLFVIAVLFTFFVAIGSFIGMFSENINVDSIIWCICNILFFIVLISGYKKTLFFLKCLSTISLFFFLYRYTIAYLYSHGLLNIPLVIGDIKFIVIYLFVIFGGELVIENRSVQIN